MNIQEHSRKSFVVLSFSYDVPYSTRGLSNNEWLMRLCFFSCLIVFKHYLLIGSRIGGNGSCKPPAASSTFQDLWEKPNNCFIESYVLENIIRPKCLYSLFIPFWGVLWGNFFVRLPYRAALLWQSVLKAKLAEYERSLDIELKCRMLGGKGGASCHLPGQQRQKKNKGVGVVATPHGVLSGDSH